MEQLIDTLVVAVVGITLGIVVAYIEELTTWALRKGLL